MEYATDALRRSGRFLLTYNSCDQDLDMIIGEINILRSKIKAMRDSEKTISCNLIKWSNAEQNKHLQELFLYLDKLNAIWSEVETELADQMKELRHHFEMILEGEKLLEVCRVKLTNLEELKEKALKKLLKAEKKNSRDAIEAAKANLEDINRQKESVEKTVTEKIKENEAVKLIRLKQGYLNLTQAYLVFSTKCRFIFEAQKVILNALPDVEDQEIHEIRFNKIAGADDIIQRTLTLVTEYGASLTSSSQQNTEPPPPYSNEPFSPDSLLNLPYNPHYAEGINSPDGSGPSTLYPNLTPDVALSNAMKDVKISKKP